MIKKFASLIKRIKERLKEMADQIYATIGAVAMTIGFSLLVVSIGDKDYTLAYTSIFFAVIGTIMVTLAYLGARKKESNERRMKLIEYNNAIQMINELKEANRNIYKLFK
jgi:Na+/melibiose symporter-like transporter